MSRADDTTRFYELLDTLAKRTSGPRQLHECTSRSGWPSHGVYFFFEPGETRRDSDAPRCVRVGTHALRPTSRTTLWKRLSQHRGQVGGRNPGTGNHRGSVFRQHVGTALLASHSYPVETLHSWLAAKPSEPFREVEFEVERAVSNYIGRMPVLWLEVPTRTDGSSDRGIIEVNAIALLSRRVGGADAPSSGWLGQWANSEKVRTSGIWNVNHVDESYDPGFLDVFDSFIRQL
jgi:hypothetical protein